MITVAVIAGARQADANRMIVSMVTYFTVMINRDGDPALSLRVIASASRIYFAGHTANISLDW